MVRLITTDAMLAAMDLCSKLDDGHGNDQPHPAPGQPITHTQVLGLSKRLRAHFAATDHEPPNAPTLYDLDSLLRGSGIYIEPAKPKPEPSPSYKALMADLRAAEESRAYARMLEPAPPRPETFAQRFPYARLFPDGAAAAAAVAAAPPEVGDDDDELTFADINRQLALIINVLVSVVACSVALWMASSHWSTPLRLGLSMGGSGVVGVAEVVVYAGYLRRVGEAKAREGRRVERREVVGTWVLGGKGTAVVALKEREGGGGEGDGVRRRKKEAGMMVREGG